MVTVWVITSTRVPAETEKAAPFTTGEVVVPTEVAAIQSPSLGRRTVPAAISYVATGSPHHRSTELKLDSLVLGSIT